MSKKARILSLVLASSLTLSVFAGCGDGDTGTSNAGTEGGTPVSIEVWYQESDTEGLKLPNKVLSLYQESNPDFTADLVPAGDADSYVQKVLMAASSDTLPELFMATCANIVGIPETGVLLDISDKMDDDWKSRFIPSAFSLQHEFYGDGIYGIPDHNEIQGWFMNKRLFEEQGLEIPTTWEDWTKCIETFTSAGITPIAYGATDIWSRWGFDLFFDRYGFVDNKEALINKEMKFSDFCLPAFERIDELAKMNAFPSNVSTASHSEALELFKGGECPIITVGSWALSDLLDSEEADNFVFTWGPEFSDSSYNQKVATKTCSWTYWISQKAGESDAKLDATLGFLKTFSEEEIVNYSVEELAFFTVYNYNGDVSNLSPLFNSLLEKSSDDYAGYGEMSSYIDPAFETAYWNAATAVVTQTATPEEAAQQLDDAQAALQ